MKTYSNKILIVVPDLSMPGGVANFYTSMQKYKGDDIVYFHIGKRKGESGFINSITRLFKDLSAFKDLIKRENFSLVVVNPSLDIKSLIRDRFLVNHLKKEGIKTITFFRGWSIGLASKKTIAKILVKPFLKSDAIIVLLNDALKSLRDFGYNEKIYLETTTVSDDLLTDTERKFEKEKFNILFLARIEPLKGVYEAVNTLKILHKKYPFVKLIMAGNGSEMANLQEYTIQNKIEGIEYPGYVKGDDKIKYFENADLYLFPSFHNEGMPNSVLEAMAFGLPVVAHEIGGLKDFFLNREMGFITNSKSPEVFSDLIGQLIEDKDSLTRISKFNMTYSRSRFISSIVMERLKTIFTEVIEK